MMKYNVRKRYRKRHRNKQIRHLRKLRYKKTRKKNLRSKCNCKILTLNDF